MDKETLSHYGWIVIICLILAVMIAFTTPFGNFVGRSANNISQGFIDTNKQAISDENVQGLENQWSDYIQDSDDNFPHATGTTFNIETFRNQCKDLLGTISFSTMKAPADGIDISSGDKSVILVINGEDATIYSKDGGGVFCPDYDTENNNGIFEGFKASIFNFEGLDTSKTKSFECMFAETNTNTIDVSKFNISNATTMSNMFAHSTIGTVYCYNQEEIDILKSTSLCPETLRFTIK